MTAVRVRPRRPADLPMLADLLWAQQPVSRYPFRNPLPIPVEEFLHAEDAVAAWTAEIAGRPVGQVCRVAPVAGFPEAESMNAACAAAHQCEVDELAWVSSLFVGLDARRAGVGRQLLETVVDDIRSDGRYPCLEVLPTHRAALTMYETTGWREVMRLRPGWLRQAGDETPDVVVMTLGRTDLRSGPASSVDHVTR